ncbi:tape measure protein [Rhodococcus sp. NPDC019627]|uniref:tape measure protein n=1 Tax=unclassified Rhodococcus (in: high G+C Gram-positive bacteria) TaxID=192944 RepID=UPI0033E2DCEF
MAGVELATAYVSLVVDTKKIPGQVKTALSGVEAQADNTGKSVGSKIASGLGSTLKVGGAAIGAAAGLAIGTALTKGMERVVAIDDAKGKLAGLGHTAEGVATIMDSALKSVKGTAYGLGDAAGIAASAVAAGIKPGEELTKYLSLTGDAATIAGSSLGEMGSIFNKVTTSGKAYTDNLNQLADRGIPIFQWLQEEYGVTADGLSDMVKEGKVDAETFRKVIEENIGGAALESGKTLRGSYENMKAALGRVGAGAIEPFLPMLKSGLGALTQWADKIAPKVKQGAEFVATGLTEMGRAFQSSGASIDGPASNFEKFGVKARYVSDGLKGIWSILKDGEFAGSKLTFGLDENSKAVDILFRIREGAIALWAAIKDPSSEKFTAFLDKLKGSGDESAGAMGKVEEGATTLTGVLKSVGDAAASGGLALAALGGDTATVAVAGIKALGSVMGFFADHTGLATVALGGFAASVAIAKTVETGFHAAKIANAIMMPAQIASQMALTRALIAHTAALWANTGAQAPNTALTLRARIAEIATAAAHRVRTAAVVSETSALGAYAAAQQRAAATSGLMVGGLRNAAAGAAVMAGRVQNLSGAAVGGLRSGLGSAVSLLGGPVSAGLMAAGAAAIYMGSQFSSANKRIEDSASTYRSYVDGLKESNSKLKDAFNSSGGVADRSVSQIVEGQISDLKSAQAQLAQDGPGFWGKIGSSFATGWDILDGQLDGAAIKTAAKAEDLSLSGAKVTAAFDKLGMSSSDLGKVLTGPSDKFSDLAAKLHGMGDEGLALLGPLKDMRTEIIASQTSAGQFKTALADIDTKSVSAAQGVDGLTSAMGRLRGDQMTAEEAQQRVNDALRGFGEAAASAGTGVIDASGKIDTATAAGSQLFNSMKQVQSAFDQAGASAYQSAVEQGQSQEAAAAASEAAGQRVRDEFIKQRVEAGYTLEQATAIADQYKLYPPEIATAIKLNGAKEVQDQLGYIGTLLANITAPREVNLPAPQVNVNSPGGSLGGPSLNFPGAPKADGGPITGGIAGQDSVPILAMPGEHMLTTADVDRLGGQAGVYRFRAALAAGVVGKFAEGGAIGGVSGGIQAALNAGRAVTGNKYLWGGSGPERFDCSGFVGWLQQIAMGITGSVKRLYTTYDLMGSNGFAGLLPGLGPAGTQFQVGVSQEHMAATVGGQPAESGGSHGDSRIGAPAVGATDPQFSEYFHLPNSAVAGGVVSGTLGLGSYGRTKKKVEWTDKDELNLQSADVSVTQAEEDLAAVQAKFNEGKKTQADLDQAHLRVRKAEARVVELQKKKDDAAAGVDEGPAPQAPALAKAYSDKEMERIDAQLSVDDANERRNEVYADPTATENDRIKADMALAKAQNSLQEVLDGKDKKSDSSGSGDYSLKGILKTFGTRMLDVGMTALEGQDPFGITSSRWWTTDFTKTGSNGETSAQAASGESGGGLADAVKPKLEAIPGSWPDAEIAGQTGGLPGTPADWVKLFGAPEELLEKFKAPKVFDNGGWLQPGEMGINLSNRPEPIFNSPDQLRKFAGNALAPAEAGGGQSVDNSINISGVTVADINEFRSMLNLEQRKRSLSFNRR